jgi:hypothetical protein
LRRVSISEIVEKPVSGEWGNEVENSSDGGISVILQYKLFR